MDRPSSSTARRRSTLATFVAPSVPCARRRALAFAGAALLSMVLVPAASPVRAADLSRQYYVQYCVGCHQMDGSGSAASSIPDMRGQLGRFVRTAAGRAFLVQVPGSSSAPISDAQLAQMLNWLVRAMSPGDVPADFRPYTGPEVAQLRATVPADVTTRRREVIAELQSLGIDIR